MDITVIQERCIGCGNCVEICQTVFYLNDETGKSEIIDPDACEYAGCCEAAAENCPVEAIVIKT